MHDHSTSLSRNSHSPAMSDSGISVDAASNNSGSSASMMNVAALAKLQSGTMICVRFWNTIRIIKIFRYTCIYIYNLYMYMFDIKICFFMRLLNIWDNSFTVGLPQTPVGTAPPSISQSDTNFNSLLNPSTPQSESPNLETLASLLQQPPSSLTGGMGSVGSIGSMSSIGTIGSMNMNSTSKDMADCKNNIYN